MSSIAIETSIPLIINENLISSIIIKNSIFLDCSTTLNCRILVKTIITLTNFLFKLLNTNVNLLSTISKREKFNKLTQDFEKSFLFVRKSQKFKSTSQKLIKKAKKNKNALNSAKKVSLKMLNKIALI